jgi:hypothetical protein
MTPAPQGFASLSAEAACAVCTLAEDLTWLRHALSQAKMSP